MHSKTPPRNRLAKALPESWRKVFVERGIPKRKYAAILQVTLVDGRVIDDVIVEQGWIISIGREGLSGIFEQRIDFDPRSIEAIQIIQVA